MLPITGLWIPGGQPVAQYRTAWRIQALPGGMAPLTLSPAAGTTGVAGRMTMAGHSGWRAVSHANRDISTWIAQHGEINELPKSTRLDRVHRWSRLCAELSAGGTVSGRMARSTILILNKRSAQLTTGNRLAAGRGRHRCDPPIAAVPAAGRPWLLQPGFRCQAPHGCRPAPRSDRAAGANDRDRRG